MITVLNKIKESFTTFIIIVLLVIICGFLLKSEVSKRHEISELKDKIAEMENRKIQVDSIREEVREISKYSAYEYNYKSVIYFSDKKTFQGIPIPLTGNNFLAAIEGTMDIGINGEAVEITETTDSEGNVTQVTLTVPHSEILDNHTIQDSLEIFDEKNNIFNPVKVTDYHELIMEAEETELQKVQESDVLQRSDERIAYLLSSYLQKVYGEHVEIKHGYVS